MLVLPVSLGEALDKLTILEIKAERISDEVRKADVFREIEALLPTLVPYKEKYEYLYKILKHCNTIIWDLQDSFHGKSAPPVEVCQAILRENDRRFRIKRKINDAAGSTLKEQKGYKGRRAFIYTHLGLGDMIWMNGAVRYLASEYDSVTVVCKRHYEKNVRAMYADDPSIELFVVNDDADIYPWWVGGKRRVQIPDTDIFECGLHGLKKQIYLLPKSFYDDLAVPYEYAKLYFHVAPQPAAAELAAKYKDIPYILIHEKSSCYWANIFESVSASGKLVLDINTNHYPAEHPWHELAEAVVGRPLFEYVDLIKGAEELHLIESSLFCLAASLDISAVKRRVCYNGYGEGASPRTGGLFEDGKVQILRK
jgi:hypothetical protein